MQKRVLMLATSAFILAYGAATASAQQGPMMQPQAQTQQQERPLQGAQIHEVALKITSMTIAR